jgi:hypothetical protein
LTRAVKGGMAAGGVGALLLLSLFVSPAAGRAAAAPTPDYVQRLAEARRLVLDAEHGNPSAALQAAHLADTGDPANDRLVADLRGQPPNLTDALQQIEVLMKAAQAPPPGDSSTAQARLKSILAEPRFQEAPPTLWDRLTGAFFNFLAGVFNLLFGSGGSGVLLLIEVVVLIAAIAVAAYVGVLLLRGRGTATQRESKRRPATEHPADAAARFAEADRLAAAGDFGGALLALTGAVATALGGQGAWEASPLTVRELFGRRAVVDPLRPLLIPFEGLAYGRRHPTETVYTDAAAAAAGYRGRPG